MMGDKLWLERRDLLGSDKLRLMMCYLDWFFQRNMCVLSWRYTSLTIYGNWPLVACPSTRWITCRDTGHQFCEYRIYTRYDDYIRL